MVDQGVAAKKYPKAIHVFVEASTYWGGSQFINSPGSGQYGDYLLKDLYPAVREHFSISDDPKKLCVMGGSSGGYGALALISEKESPFGLALAVAPDSFFDASLLPDQTPDDRARPNRHPAVSGKFYCCPYAR